jgi:hypothetical protein
MEVLEAETTHQAEPVKTGPHAETSAGMVLYIL